MSKNTRITIRFVIGIIGLVLIVVAIVFMTRHRPESELPDSIPATYAFDSPAPSDMTGENAAQSPLPSDADATATPGLSWEWLMDSNGKIVIDPSSSSDIPSDTDGTAGANADTP